MSSPTFNTDGTVARAARAAAVRLVDQHTSTLQTDVEVALHAGQADQQPGQFFDPISLGALIVSVASLAWTIYTDLRSKTAKPAAQVIARRVRLRLPRDQTGAAERDRVIEVVIDEIIKDVDGPMG